MYPTSSLFLLGLVAQGIEHRFPKPGVASSNLAEAAFVTTYIQGNIVNAPLDTFYELSRKFYHKRNRYTLDLSQFKKWGYDEPPEEVVN